MRRSMAIILTAVVASSGRILRAEESGDYKSADEVAELLQEEQVDSAQLGSKSSASTPSKSPAIEEITVTVQKREQKLFDVPMSISAFSGDALAEMGAENLMDVAVATPSFSVSEDGPGVQSIQLRGIASDEIRLLNARLSWEVEGYDVALFARNINDVRASQSASVEAYSALTRPRQIGIEINLQF